MRELTRGDLISLAGGTPCDSCHNQRATEKYDGDQLCGGCAETAKAQDAAN